MKKTLFFFTGLCLLSLFAAAQTLSVTGFGGYNFRDKVEFSNAYGYVNEGGYWGAAVEGISRSGQGIELMYLQQSTHIPLYYYNFPSTQINEGTDKTTVSYLMLNGVHYLLNPKVQPYGGLGLGVAFISSESYDSQTKFAWDARLGVKFKASPQLGFKVQAQLFSVVQAAGGTLYAGTGSVGSYSSIYQFGFSGGICYDFTKKQLP